MEEYKRLDKNYRLVDKPTRVVCFCIKIYLFFSQKIINISKILLGKTKLKKR